MKCTGKREFYKLNLKKRWYPNNVPRLDPGLFYKPSLTRINQVSDSPTTIHYREGMRFTSSLINDPTKCFLRESYCPFTLRGLPVGGWWHSCYLEMDSGEFNSSRHCVLTQLYYLASLLRCVEILNRCIVSLLGFRLSNLFLLELDVATSDILNRNSKL